MPRPGVGKQEAAVVRRMGEMVSSGLGVDELEALYRADLTRFVRTAAAIVGDEAAGRDAVQEAFAHAVRHRARFRGQTRLEAWVWRIVVNEAISARRHRVAQRRLELAASEVPSTNHVPEHDAAVRAWVAALPDRQRHAVFLRYFADLDYRSIAAVLDIEVGTVSATLAKAHAALRRSFAEVKR
jgi:RNA polymerase sigma-70 factor, ECF subfamily